MLSPQNRALEQTTLKEPLQEGNDLSCLLHHPLTLSDSRKTLVGVRTSCYLNTMALSTLVE